MKKLIRHKMILGPQDVNPCTWPRVSIYFYFQTYTVWCMLIKATVYCSYFCCCCSCSCWMHNTKCGQISTESWLGSDYIGCKSYLRNCVCWFSYILFRTSQFRTNSCKIRTFVVRTFCLMSKSRKDVLRSN